MTSARDIAHAMCEAAEVVKTHENLEQAEVFAEAYLIFCQRTGRHGEVWKDSGWRGALFDIRKKVDRLWREFMLADEPPSDLDSALDALNYIAFFVRARMHNIEGTWRWK